jgi:GT2 family glycosyltransferase
LRALAGQSRPAERIDVVVVDDSPERSGKLPPWARGWARIVHSGGVGAASARNHGATAARASQLLFLDDDVIADPGCVEAHLSATAEMPRAGMVIGHTPPRPAVRNRVTSAAALWWETFLDEMAGEPELRFTDMLSGHVSMPADVFRQLGGFDASLGRLRREDWLFGLRAKLADVPMRHAPSAVAHHEFALTTAQRLRAAWWEGAGDAVLAARHPDVVSALPQRRELRRGEVLPAGVLSRTRGPAAFARALDALEAGGSRRVWLRLFSRAQELAYQSGRGAGAAPAAPPPAATVAVRADTDGPIAVPGPLCPPLEVHGPWGPCVVDVPLGRLTAAVVRVAAAALADPGPAAPEPVGAQAAVEVLEPLTDDHADVVGRWARVNEAVRRSSADWVAVPLAPPTDPAAFEAALVDALDGDRVAAFIGAAADGGQRSTAVRARWLHPERHTLFGAPPQYLAVSVRHHAAVGGLRAALARHGATAPALDFVERALDHDLPVAYVDLPGAAIPAAWQRAERQRQRARGALVSAEPGPPAPLRIVRGAMPVLRTLRRPRASWRWAAAAGLGYAEGVLDGLLRPVPSPVALPER